MFCNLHIPIMPTQSRGHGTQQRKVISAVLSKAGGAGAMPAALGGHVLQPAHTYHAHAKPWAWHPTEESNFRRSEQSRWSGCHAHRFGWACSATCTYLSCPRKAVGMAPNRGK